MMQELRGELQGVRQSNGRVKRLHNLAILFCVTGLDLRVVVLNYTLGTKGYSYLS